MSAKFVERNVVLTADLRLTLIVINLSILIVCDTSFILDSMRNIINMIKVKIF